MIDGSVPTHANPLTLPVPSVATSTLSSPLLSTLCRPLHHHAHAHAPLPLLFTAARHQNTKHLHHAPARSRPAPPRLATSLVGRLVDAHTPRQRSGHPLDIPVRPTVPVPVPATMRRGQIRLPPTHLSLSLSLFTVIQQDANSGSTRRLKLCAFLHASHHHHYRHYRHYLVHASNCPCPNQPSITPHHTTPHPLPTDSASGPG